MANLTAGKYGRLARALLLCALALRPVIIFFFPISRHPASQDRVSEPVLSFEGERDATANPDAADNTFLRTVTITMNCSTPNATLHYTTDGVSYPGERAPSVAPGTQLQWSEEGTTEFSVVAFAEGWYKSEETAWEVTIVAPTTDEHAVAEGADGERGSELAAASFARGRGRDRGDLRVHTYA